MVTVILETLDIGGILKGKARLRVSQFHSKFPSKFDSKSIIIPTKQYIVYKLICNFRLY